MLMQNQKSNRGHQNKSIIHVQTTEIIMNTVYQNISKGTMVQTVELTHTDPENPATPDNQTSDQVTPNLPGKKIHTTMLRVLHKEE